MNDRLHHDLRHWLTALLAALDDSDLGRARRIAEQLTALLGGARVGAVSVNEAMAAHRGPGVEVVPAEPDLTIRADPAALGRVLINLLANARQSGERVVLRAVRDGRFAAISVADSGSGMPPEIVDRAFEAGFTTKADGSGLGLAIVHDLVTAAKGNVTVDCVLGSGTTVTARWPLLVPSRAGTLLLVEDEPMVRQIAERAFRATGWDVIAVGSADGALAVGRRPNALVADLALGGMDGRALIGILRARWPKLPAVLVSGYADSTVSADPDGRSVVFLAKPYAIGALIAAVGDAIASVRD